MMTKLSERQLKVLARAATLIDSILVEKP